MCLVVLGGLTETLQAQQRIMPPRQRQEILQKAADALDQKARTVDIVFSELHYPFAFPRAEQPETGEAVQEVVVTEPERPADAEILRILMDRVQPTGTAIRGDNRFLIFSRGQVAEGGSIGMQYQGRNYQIIVESISLENNSYQLRLNEATEMRYLGRRSGSGTIERD